MSEQSPSLKPSEASEGLLDDVSVEWVKVKFTTWDYQGKAAATVPALCVSLKTTEGEEADQYYSMGRADDWVPSDDGKRLLPVGRASKLSKSSNGMLLLGSLIDAGFPEDKITDDCSVFQGLECHMLRQKQPKRTGLEGARADATILLVSEIHKLPWEKAKSAPAKGKKAEEKGGDEVDVTAEATDAVLQVLAEEESVTKKQIATKVFKIVKSHPQKSAITSLVYSNEFLESGPWEFDGETISM